MHATQLLAVLIGLSAAPLAMAGDCQNEPGAANGECVRVFSGTGCSSEEAAFKPTCEGNCFQLGFSSIHVGGDGTFGTDCIGYSDANCQTEMSNTGNIVFGPGICQDFPNAQSMKCFYRC